ncbi:MAG: dockerin type I repeat-containing protein [Oscillospiraceae bacterium]|nr:dockerin type I repeat-containing protein [Oscillospiraceae bacterium]
MNALAEEGGNVVICSDITIDDDSAILQLPAKNGKVTITGQNDARLAISFVVALGSETEIDNIELCCAAPSFGFIYASGHKLTIGENVTTTQEGTGRWLTIFGGYSDGDGPSTHIVVKAGKYEHIYGANFNATFTGTTKVEVSNVEVTGDLTGKSINNFAGTAELIVDLRSGKTVVAPNLVEPTFLVDDGYKAVKDGNTYKQVEKTDLTFTVAPTEVADGEAVAIVSAKTTVDRKFFIAHFAVNAPEGFVIKDVEMLLPEASEEANGWTLATADNAGSLAKFILLNMQKDENGNFVDAALDATLIKITYTVPATFAEADVISVTCEEARNINEETVEVACVDGEVTPDFGPVVGDINADGAVTVIDVLILLRAVLNDVAVENGDLNGDGTIGLIDVIRVMKLATA